MGTKPQSFSDAMEKQIKKHQPKTTGLECEYCGKVKEEFSFFIGAAIKADWCMHEGTGKVSCPDCYDKAQAEAKNRMERLLK